jgi:hypothetical protein
MKLGREWYHSAQSTQLSSDSIGPEDSSANDTIHEEGSQDEHEKFNQTHEDEKNQASEFSKSTRNTSASKSSAASELRLHELVALLTCFVSPVMGAWLLHTMRSQLSRPSEGLVSNYNLTVFLLAAELRPLAHLVKLIQARTLYLQRSLHPSLTNPTFGLDSQKLQDLSARFDDIEAHIATAITSNAHKPPSNPPISAQMTTEVRKSLQPDLDALNRAVRRYEKRATLLSMQTESRLQDLESRMADAITLAAAAERNNSHTLKHGSALTLLDWVCAAVVFPVHTIRVCINLPAKVARSTFMAVEGYVIRKVRRRARVMGRGDGGEVEKGSHERKSMAKGRGTKKVS